jgi:hypothetical protein
VRHKEGGNAAMRTALDGLVNESPAGFRRDVSASLTQHALPVRTKVRERIYECSIK